MTHNGTDNLRCYVREAILPQMINGPSAPAMPMDGHKSHLNTLRIRPEQYRKLETMYRFKDIAFDEVITSWIDTYIPEGPLGVDDEDEATGERLSIPIPLLFNIPQQKLARPSDIFRLSQWFDVLPLQTAQRVMHLVYPPTAGWGFNLDNERDMDDSIFRHFFWTSQTPGTPITPEIGQHSLIIAFQTPWVLSPYDLERFVDCRSFPQLDLHSGTNPSPLQSKERLWGKLWDVCVRKKCPWFVLSNYSGWCFGAFSRGWTRAFVSSVYNFDSCSPTILECVLFWLVSAMRLPGSWKIPEVPEPVVNLAPNFSIPAPHNVRCDITPSESSWDGKSDATGTSAGFNRPLSPLVSEVGLPFRAFPLQMPRPRNDMLSKVFEWTQTVAPSNPMPPEELPPSPALSDWSSSSSSTIVDVSDRGYCGDWLVIPPSENPVASSGDSRAV